MKPKGLKQGRWCPASDERGRFRGIRNCLIKPAGFPLHLTNDLYCGLTEGRLREAAGVCDSLCDCLYYRTASERACTREP